MSGNKGSGHGGNTGKYQDVHPRVVVVCAFKPNGKVDEYWWTVSPPAAQMKRNKSGHATDAVVYWQLFVYDQANGNLVGDFSIASITMGDGWDDAWGQPMQNPHYSDGQHWMMGLAVPAGTDHQSYGYSITVDVGSDTIVIDPEVDFEPGE